MKNATEKQLDFIGRLATERGMPMPTGILTRSQASDTISDLLKVAKTVIITTAIAGKTNTLASALSPVTEAGMYRLTDGTIVRVQKAKYSGGLYAKKLVNINGERLNQADNIVHWDFQ